MTPERRKSLFILSLALISGILIGLLLPGLFFKLDQRQHRGRGDRNHDTERKRAWFEQKIYGIIEPDSDQAKKIRPITSWATAQIDSIENGANAQMEAVLDSVKGQLKPILTVDQQKRLDDFHEKARKNWDGKKGPR